MVLRDCTLLHNRFGILLHNILQYMVHYITMSVRWPHIYFSISLYLFDKSPPATLYFRAIYRQSIKCLKGIENLHLIYALRGNVGLSVCMMCPRNRYDDLAIIPPNRDKTVENFQSTCLGAFLCVMQLFHYNQANTFSKPLIHMIMNINWHHLHRGLCYRVHVLNSWFSNK